MIDEAKCVYLETRLLEAGKPDARGNIFTEEGLKRIARNDVHLVYKEGALYLKGWFCEGEELQKEEP